MQAGSNEQNRPTEFISETDPPSPTLSHNIISISESKPSVAVVAKFKEDERAIYKKTFVPCRHPSMSMGIYSLHHENECFGTRHVLALLSFLGFANVYAMRVNLSVAIVAMVNSTAIPQQNHSSNDSCPVSPSNSTTPSQDGEFFWDEATQGIILGSFFWGYIITNPIGGRLGEIYGGKRVFCIGVFITSILTLLTPMAANSSLVFLVILRVIIGLGEGVTFPAMNSMMAKWIPPLERSQTSSMVFTGGQFGIIVALPICGILCQSSFLGGWPSTFYVFGILGLVWCSVWMYFIYDSPSQHPNISEEERMYINTSLNQGKSKKLLPIPFRHIITSLPFWATMCAHVSQNWGFYFLLTELPTYMKNILHFNIRDIFLTSYNFSVVSFVCVFLHLRRCKSRNCSNQLKNWDNYDSYYIHRACISRSTLALRPNQCSVGSETAPDKIENFGRLTLEWRFLNGKENETDVFRHLPAPKFPTSFLLVAELQGHGKQSHNNSFLSALPYLATWIFSLAMGFLADNLRSTGRLSTTATRRIFNSIGFYCPMVCLVLVGYSGCNTYLTVTLLTVAVGFTGAQYSGYMNSHLDMAPNYAGTLMGLTNCVATIPGFVAPIVVGSLINGQETLGQWRLVFWIAGIIYFIGNTVYVIFISGEEQPWNRMYEKEFESLIQQTDGEAEHTSYGGNIS